MNALPLIETTDPELGYMWCCPRCNMMVDPSLGKLCPHCGQEFDQDTHHSIYKERKDFRVRWNT